MHRHIKIVAVLLIVEGSLETLMGILLCVIGPVMMTFMKSAPPPPSAAGPAPPPELFGAIYIAMGVVTLVAGVLKIVAGIRNVSFKGRTLGFVALGSSVLALASCYCIPTAIGLAVYGLVVYLDQKSAQAFQMGASGMPPDQILAQIEGVPQAWGPPPGYS